MARRFRVLAPSNGCGDALGARREEDDAVGRGDGRGVPVALLERAGPEPAPVSTPRVRPLSRVVEDDTTLGLGLGSTFWRTVRTWGLTLCFDFWFKMPIASSYVLFVSLFSFLGMVKTPLV